MNFVCRNKTLISGIATCFTGTALGVWVSSGISGGHINPAVTIALAAFRDFPWRKVPVFVFAQVMGGLCGAGIIYANYIHAIDLVEGGRHVRTVPGTASLFSTYAVRSYYCRQPTET
jgi:aquaglyceroporin related protein, other eukaryote